jgi:hypothetical protein
MNRIDLHQRGEELHQAQAMIMISMIVLLGEGVKDTMRSLEREI